MKICFFSKYPPIEGGTSARAYWLSKGLGEKGLEIHIVTNALEIEQNFKETVDWEDLNDLSNYQPKNVLVHSLNSDPYCDFFHIPHSPAYLERLVNRGIEIIEQFQCDLVDSFYILPYGLAGFFAKILTGKPQILRHAGSDLYKIFFKPDFKRIFLIALKNADRIVTDESKVPFLQQMGVKQNFYFRKPYTPHPSAFNPKIEPFDFKKLGADIKKGIPVITFIGKFSKEFKGIYELTRALNTIQKDFFVLFVTGGKEVTEFKTYLNDLKGLDNKYKIVGFVPPWHIPEIIKGSSCVIQLEKNFPVAIHGPSQLCETMAVGKPCLISDVLYEKFRERLKLESGKNVLVANPKNQSQLEEKLELIISKPELLEKIGQAAHNAVDWQKEFDEYIENNIRLYEEVANQKSAYIDRALELYEKIVKKFKPNL